LDIETAEAEESTFYEESGDLRTPGLSSNGKSNLLSACISCTVDQILAEGSIAHKEATFCLLDQRTFECHWQTLVKLAAYKERPQIKIELLYFLGIGWLHRAFSGLKDQQIAEKWWAAQTGTHCI
jgi:hypothetical protein